MVFTVAFYNSEKVMVRSGRQEADTLEALIAQCETFMSDPRKPVTMVNCCIFSTKPGAGEKPVDDRCVWSLNKGVIA